MILRAEKAEAELAELREENERLKKRFKALYDSYCPGHQYEAFEEMYTRLECAFRDVQADLAAMRKKNADLKDQLLRLRTPHELHYRLDETAMRHGDGEGEP